MEHPYIKTNNSKKKNQNVSTPMGNTADISAVALMISAMLDSADIIIMY